MDTISIEQILPFLSERGRLELDLAITRYQLAAAQQIIAAMQATDGEISPA